MERTRASRKAALAGVALALGTAGAGCGEYEGEDGSPVGTDGIEQLQSALLEGARISTDSAAPNELQSESSSTVQLTTGFGYTGFNAGDSAHLTFPTTTSRRICKGTSALGFNVRNANGAFNSTMSRLAVPSGYSVLWSDPAMGAAADSVYFAMLGSPTDRFNVASGNQDCWTNSNGASASPMLSGACIFRSTSQTLTPNFGSNVTCVRTANDFYDGGSLSGDPFGGNAIIASFWNITQNRVDVWRGPSPSWTRTATPFATQNIGGHPLAAGGVAVVVPDSVGNLWISNYHSNTNTWSNPISVGGPVAPSTTLSDGTNIRQVGFSFVFAGQLSFNVPYTFYVAYMKAVAGGKTQIRVTSCTMDSVGFGGNINVCGDLPALATPTTSNAFMPALASAHVMLPGAQTPDVHTRLSYFSDEGLSNGNVQLRSFNFNNPSAQAVTPAQRTCPDNRSYWGDYDDMFVVDDFTPNPTFVRPYTDSTDTTCSRQTYTANPQHVSVAVLPLTDFSALTLINGWTNSPFSTGPAAASVSGGIVTLRGAIATTGTNAVPFTLPSAFRPSTNVYVPIDTCAATKGRLFIQSNGTVTVEAQRAFSDAQCFTGLDGVSFARNATSFTALTLQNGWTNAPFGTRNAAVIKDNGFVRMQGAISTTGTNAVPFTLPAAFRPATNVYVPVDLCSAKKGRLFIQPSGTVTVQAEVAFADAQCFTSLEGVTYAVSPAISTGLTLQNGWTNAPFSTRNAAAVYDRRMIRLVGAIATTGTNALPFTLPAGWRPTRNTYVPITLCNSTKGRLFIQSTGSVTVQTEGPFSNAQCFTSLEGAAFSL